MIHRAVSVGGYEFETLSLGLPFMAAFLNPGALGTLLHHRAGPLRQMAGMWIVGEDMPREKNRITLHAKRRTRRHADRRRAFR